MDILGHIEKMKAKPEHIRKRYAFSISFAFSLVIFAGWIASYGIKSSPVLADKNGKNSPVIESPMSSLTASVSNAFKDIKNIFSGGNKIEYNSEYGKGNGGIEVEAGSR